MHSIFHIVKAESQKIGELHSHRANVRAGQRRGEALGGPQELLCCGQVPQPYLQVHPVQHRGGAGGGEGQPNEAPQAAAFNTTQAELAASAQAAAAETELVRLKLEVHETLHGMMDSDEITIEQKDVIGFAISRLASQRPDDNEPWYLRMMHRLFVSKPHPLARQMLILRGQLNDLAFSAPLGSIP